MKATAMVQGIAVWLAALGLCLPTTALAATSTQPESTAASDVSLGEGGVLIGQVVDPQGAPLAGVPVSLRVAAQEVGVASTDADGRFAFRGLRGGVYQIVAAEGHGVFRTWVPGTVPPSAQAGALLIAGKEAVRGQCACDPAAGCGCGCAKFWLCNPCVCVGLVAAAIAIPVALHNSGHTHAASP